jgi:hypothetical protein
MENRPAYAILFLLLAAAVSAAPLPAIESEISHSLDTSMCYIFGVLKYIVGPIAIMFLVWLAIQYVGAQEDTKRRQKAKEDMKEVLLALIFIEVIPYLVNTFAGGTLIC